MATMVVGMDAVDAWKSGARLILQQPGRALHNVVTEISDPTSFDPSWYGRYSPKTVNRNDSLSVVTKVLFPQRGLRAGETRQAFYEREVRTLRRARAIGTIHSSWNGTYFERLVSLDGSGKRTEAAIVMHLSSPTCDALRPLGSPCLQFIEILWNRNGTIDLLAVYRHHDFINKALGNFIGLGRLLGFLSVQGQKQPGKVVCHSARAYVDRLGQMQTLLAR